MTYRDELGALYAKVEALESKLKERDPQDEHIAELKSLKEKVRAIEAGRLPAARMTTWLVACVGLSLFTSLLVSAIVSSPATKTPEEIIKELPKVEMPPASLGSSFMVDAPKEPVAKSASGTHCDILSVARKDHSITGDAMERWGFVLR